MRRHQVRMPFSLLRSSLPLGHTWQEALAMVFICGIISLIITLTKVRKMIIEFQAPASSLFPQLGSESFWLMVLKMPACLLSIDPGNYTVAGKGVVIYAAAITANSAATPGLVDLTIQRSM